jgi:uncharacterized protein (TIGR02271 family)
MAINRGAIADRYPSLVEGMTVYSNDGERMGKITALGDDYFIVEKGIFFPKDFTFRYDDIQDVRDDNIYLAHGRENFHEWRDEKFEGWQKTDDLNLRDERDADLRRDDTMSSDEVRVPVTEEKLDIQKTAREAGEVRLRKVVHSELKTITVPVMKEEVKVERVPIAEGERTASADASFDEKTIRVPVMEEEVTVNKRPVVKEEVVVSKERTIEDRKIEDEVKREDVEIEGEDELKRRKAG